MSIRYRIIVFFLRNSRRVCTPARNELRKLKSCTTKQTKRGAETKRVHLYMGLGKKEKKEDKEPGLYTSRNIVYPFLKPWLVAPFGAVRQHFQFKKGR
jgi:hypothetical protein